MKKILSILAVVLLGAIGAYGQAPGIFNYQGVARNSVGNVLINKSITLRITIHDGSAAGPTVYQESRGVVTNPFGLFNAQVGSPGATSVTGTIAGVTWGVGLKYIQVEIDPNGGSTFINIGTAQVASVPYALYSNLAGDLVLPFNKTQADAGTLFKITNSGTGTGSTALEGLTNSTANSVNAITGTVTSTSPGGFSAGLRGINNGTGGLGIGVYGSQNGSGWGVYGTTPSGIGVYGNTTSGTGVWGQSNSGIGVFGTSSTGSAGSFSNTNAANTAATLNVSNSGTGWAGDFVSTNATTRALRTSGGLRFFNLNEANNRILASDANGNALWKDPSAVGVVTGSGTIDRVPKWTPVGTNLGDSRIEDKTGILPIGINTPGGYTYTSTQPGLEMTNSAALLQTRIVLRDQSDGDDVQAFIDGRTSPTTTLSALQIGTLTNHPITFFTNGAQIGRWSAAGNFGIGTTAGVDPTTKLRVDNAGTIGSVSVNQTNAANLVPAMSVINANASSTGYGNGTIYGQRGVAPGATNFLFTGVHTAVTGITGGATTGIGVQGSGNTYGTVGLTNTGVGVVAYAVDPTGYGLATVGRIQISGQGAGVNKVLTSDAIGNATWQTLGGGVGVGGSGTLNYVSKWTPNGTNLGNSQIFDDGSRVNIGTNFGDQNSVTINNTNPGGGNASLLLEGNSGVGNASGIYIDNATNKTHLTVNNYTASSGTKIMTWDGATLNVGVGTATPKAKLHINGSSDLTQALGIANFDHQALIAQTSSTATAVISRAAIGYAANSTLENHGFFAYPNGGGAAYNVGVFSLAFANTTGNNYGFYTNVANSTNANIGIQANVPGGPNDRAGIFVGKVQIADGTQGAGRVYTSDATGTGSWQTAAAAGIVSGSGTLNFVPKWTPDGTTLGNSQIFDAGTQVQVGTNTGNGSTVNIGASGVTTSSSLSFATNFEGFNVHENASGQLNFEANNTGVGFGQVLMTMDDDALSVGIGTTTPVAKMELRNYNSTKNNFTTAAGFSGATGIASSDVTPEAGFKSGVYSFANGALGSNLSVWGDAGTTSNIGNTGLFGRVSLAPTGTGFSAGLFALDAVNGPNTWAAIVRGRLQYQDGTQGAGKVLVSDASGNASWQGPVSITARTFSSNLSIPSGIDVPITQWNTILNEDGGSNYNNVTGEYTIPVTGYYQVNASLLWDAYPSSAPTDLTLYVNGAFEMAAWATGNTFAFSNTLSQGRKYNAGDKLRFSAAQFTGSNQTLNSAYYGQTFSIELIHR